MFKILSPFIVLLFGIGQVGGAEPDSITAHDLIPFIQTQQLNFVGLSYGLLAQQCFTEMDYERFVRDGVLERIIQRSKESPSFRKIVKAIASLPSEDRIALLKKGRNTFKKTWGELGYVSPEGQTLAGQKAEKMIAERLVQLVQEMIVKTIFKTSRNTINTRFSGGFLHCQTGGLEWKPARLSFAYPKACAVILNHRFNDVVVNRGVEDYAACLAGQDRRKGTAEVQLRALLSG